jgi:hypothetical protein
MTDCLTGVRGDFDSSNSALPTLMSKGRRAARSRRPFRKLDQTAFGKGIHLNIELGQPEKVLERNQVILVAINMFKLYHNGKLAFDNPDSTDEIRMCDG